MFDRWSNLWGALERTFRRQRRGSRRRLAHDFEPVSRLRPVLTEINGDLEAQFLAIGNHLEELSSFSSRVVNTGEQLLRLATGQADGDDFLRRAIDVLLPPVQVLDDSLSRAAAVIDQLCQHQEMITDVRRLEGVLDRIVAPLKFIQTAFRIESAGLDPEVRAVFLALTRDIEQLHAQVVGLFAEQFQSLARAQEQISALVKRLRPQIKAHQQMSGDKKALIERTLEELRVALEENRRQDVRLVDAAQGLRGAVRNVVRSVQFQDITSQQLMHVDEAIGEMARRLEQMPDRRTRAGEKPWDDACVFLGDAGKVQVAQIHAVEESLTDAEKTIGAALAEIAGRADAVDHECMTLRNFRTISIEGDGVVQVVLNSLDELTHIIDRTYVMQSEVYETLRPLGNMASNLTGVIRGLSQSIRLIALNAQIQAAHVGSGTGLEVLSQRTCQIADQAAAANNDSAAALERLIGGFDEMVAESRRLQEAVGEQKTWIEGEGGAVRQQLHDYRDRTLATFMDLGGIMDSTRAAAKSALDRLPFEAAARSRLDELAGVLETFARAATGAASAQARSEPAAADLQQKYTMASERLTHEAALCRPSVPSELVPNPAPVPGLAAATAATAAAVADITLFDDDIPAVPGMPPAPAVVATAGLPPAVPAAEETAKAPVPASSNTLGDNVELF
jgi:hypothetical protein